MGEGWQDRRELWILQARPETVHTPALKATLDIYRSKGLARLLTGKSIGEKIGVGPVRVVKASKPYNPFAPERCSWPT